MYCTVKTVFKRNSDYSVVFPDYLFVSYDYDINNNNAMPQGNKDKLYKLRPLINSLNNSFIKLYNVSRQVSIDESVILFKGRSSLKQYNPMKPIKRGYKVWSMADMDGYLYKFEIYQGKNQEQNTEDAPKVLSFGGQGGLQNGKKSCRKISQSLCRQLLHISSSYGTLVLT